MNDQAEWRSGEITADVAIRPATSPVLAGGPLEIEMSVSLHGERPAYLAMGADRVRQRPQGISLDAVLEGSDASIVDPSESLPDLGGPLGVAELAPDAPLRQILLANAFLTLERIRSALEPGASGIIRIGFVCELRLALERDRAAAAPAVPAPRLEIRVPVRRDDAALEELFGRLADEAMAAKQVGLQERAIAILSTARHPAANTQLVTLASSPEPNLSGLARRAVSSQSA